MSDYTTDYIEIPLSQGKVTLVSTEDADLAKVKWYAHAHRRTHYARRNLPRYEGKQTNIKIHRVIFERILGRPLSKDESIDHINGDGLDNRRENLRLATNQQNSFNQQRGLRNTSGYKGVGWHKRHQKWQAYIRVNGKRIYLGYHDTPEDAYAAYCAAAREYFGDFARLD